MVNPKSLLVLGIASSAGNPHDSKTIAPLLSQMERTLSYQPEEVIYDRGGRGISEISDPQTTKYKKTVGTNG